MKTLVFMGRMRTYLVALFLLLAIIPAPVRGDDDVPPPPTELAEKLSAHLSDPNDAKLVKDITADLLKMTDQVASQREATPLLRRGLDFAVDHVIEFISIPTRLRELRAGARAMVVKYGVIPVSMYISGEIFEAVIAPFVLNALGGKWAMALTPLFHPNDVLFPPALMGYLKIAEKRKRWQLAAPDKFLGDRRLYRQLRNDWETKLGGDAEPVVYSARLHLTEEPQAESPVHEVHVATRMPSHASPGTLAIRDLKKALNRPLFAKELKHTSGEDQRLYGHLLLSACLDDDTARARLSQKLGWGALPASAWLEPEPSGSAIHAVPGAKAFADLVRSRLVWRDAWSFRAGGVQSYLEKLDDRKHKKVLRILANAWTRLAEQKNGLNADRELLEYTWLRLDAGGVAQADRVGLEREAARLEEKANSMLRNQKDIESLASGQGAIPLSEPEAIRDRLTALLKIGPEELPLDATIRDRLRRAFARSGEYACWALKQLGQAPLYR